MAFIKTEDSLLCTEQPASTCDVQKQSLNDMKSDSALDIQLNLRGKHQILHPEEDKAKALNAGAGGMSPRRDSAKYCTPKSVLYHHKMNLDSGKKPAHSCGHQNTIICGIMPYNL